MNPNFSNKKSQVAIKGNLAHLFKTHCILHPTDALSLFSDFQLFVDIRRGKKSMQTSREWALG
jgi:hypothetical protein